MKFKIEFLKLRNIATYGINGWLRNQVLTPSQVNFKLVADNVNDKYGAIPNVFNETRLPPRFLQLPTPRKIVKGLDMRFMYKSVLPTTMLNPHFTLSGLPPPISVLPEKYQSQISPYPLSLSPNALVPLIEKKMEYPDDPIFVLIKAREKKNIDIAQKTYKWVFSPQTEKKVIGFQDKGKKIYLVFFVKEIQMFMGIAQYKSMNFGKKFFKPTATISWIFISTLNKNNTRHLLNPYNSGKPIYEGCDGQIIKTDIGEELLRIYSESTRGKL